MTNFNKLTLQIAAAAALAGAMSMASAASGTSGTSGSAGAGIDGGGGGAAAGSSAGSNPKLGAGTGGPVGLLEKVFSGEDPTKRRKKKQAD